MKRAEDVAMALSYVDNSLAPSAVVDFERRLARDPELSAQVEVWRGQNEAIQRAFAGRRKVGGNSVTVAAFANLDRMEVRAGSGRTALNVAAFPARGRKVESRPTLDVRAPPILLSAAASMFLACFMVLFSASAPPPRPAEFRAEAAAAWQIYKGVAIRPPAIPPSLRGPRALVDMLLADSFAIPGARGPVRISFDVDELGQHYLVAFAPSDAPAKEEPEIELEPRSGDVSILWSDGRHWIALFGPGDQAHSISEVGRLRRTQ